MFVFYIPEQDHGFQNHKKMSSILTTSISTDFVGIEMMLLKTDVLILCYESNKYFFKILKKADVPNYILYCINLVIEFLDTIHIEIY